MPSAVEQRLGELCSLLEALLQTPDWNRLARLDQVIAQSLQQWPAAQMSEAETAQRVRLKRLHDQARVQCAEECERLRLLLVRHLEYSDARMAYGRVDMFKEGS